MRFKIGNLMSGWSTAVDLIPGTGATLAMTETFAGDPRITIGTSQRDDIISSAELIVAQTFDRRAVTGQLAFASGSIRAGAVALRAGETVAKVSYVGVDVGASVTLAKVAVYDSAFNLVASSASFHGALGTGMRTVTLAAPYTAVADALHYLAIVFVAATAPIVAVDVASGISGSKDAVGAGKPVSWQQTGQADLTNPATAASAGTTPLLIAS